MNNIDISILSKEPKLDVKARLTIQPLAPLSMVSELPGSYYKSLKIPSKKMICGLIENVIGWHFSAKIRTSIIKQIENNRHVSLKYENGSTYKPLLMEYFDLGNHPIITFDSLCFYDDLWARNHSRRDSAIQHAKRCRHVNSSMMEKWNEQLNCIENNVDFNKEEKNNKKNLINEKYLNKVPFFYPVLPTKREYIFMENGIYVYNAVFDYSLYSVLSSKLLENNISYLGNSEGWVHVEIEKL